MDPTSHTFSSETSADLPGPEWLRARRAAGHDAFAAATLPSESEEVWRYTPIDELALDRFTPLPVPAPLLEAAKGPVTALGVRGVPGVPGVGARRRPPWPLEHVVPAPTSFASKTPSLPWPCAPSR